MTDKAKVAAAHIAEMFPNCDWSLKMELAFWQGYNAGLAAVNEVREKAFRKLDELDEQGLGEEKSRSYASEVDDPLIGDRKALAREYR